MKSAVLSCRYLICLTAIGLVAGCSESTPEQQSATPATVPDDSGTDGNEVDWQGEFDQVFPQDRVVQISIDFDEADAYEQMLAATKQDPPGRPFYRATFGFDDEQMTDVGVRLKGNSSLWSSSDNQMKSFKIHFEEYVEDQRFHQVDRLSLNSNFKDPSIMRERLAYALANDFDMHAPRTAYAELWVDGQRHGVYTLIQQVDERFLRERFGEQNSADDGNLYKCYHKCPLEYWGGDKVAYQQSDSKHCETEDECGLALKTNEDDPALNDYADIIELTKTIEDVRDGVASTEALEAIFDMEHYVRFQAWNLVLSNLDSYYGSAHNFFIYRRPTDGRFQFIPWDVNEAYGNFGCPGQGPPPAGERDHGSEPTRGGQVLELDLWQACGSPRPLTQLVLEFPEYHQAYCLALEQFVATIYTANDQDSRIAALHELVGAAREQASVMGQPPRDFTYDEYLAAISHKSPTSSGSGGQALNLGFFNDRRMTNVAEQLLAGCQ